MRKFLNKIITYSKKIFYILCVYAAVSYIIKFRERQSSLRMMYQFAFVVMPRGYDPVTPAYRPRTMSTRNIQKAIYQAE
jgi:hypothetical protein